MMFILHDKNKNTNTKDKFIFLGDKIIFSNVQGVKNPGLLSRNTYVF